MSEVDVAYARLNARDLTPQELADIAGRHPGLRPWVAGHPLAYPGLLDWLSRQGDPAVNAALAARRAPALPTPTSMPQPFIPTTGVVQLELAYGKTMWTYGVCTPVVAVNGQVVARDWGTHVLPLPVGSPVELSVHVPYLGFRVGKATTTLTPTGPTRLQYRPPYITFARGDLGVTAKSRGRAWSYVYVALILALATWWAWARIASLPADSPPSSGAVGNAAVAPATTLGPVLPGRDT